MHAPNSSEMPAWSSIIVLVGRKSIVLYGVYVARARERHQAEFEDNGGSQ